MRTKEEILVRQAEMRARMLRPKGANRDRKAVEGLPEWAVGDGPAAPPRRTARYVYPTARCSEEVKKRRKERGYSRSALGQKCGISWSTIARIEFGDGRVNAGKFKTVIEVLGLGGRFILDVDGPSDPLKPYRKKGSDNENN